MDKKKEDISFLNKEIEVLNEISSDEVIYEESQDGPQESPIVKEYHYDKEKWNEFRQKKY